MDTIKGFSKKYSSYFVGALSVVLCISRPPKTNFCTTSSRSFRTSVTYFGGIRIGLTPMFQHGLNTPWIAELFDTRHQTYENARIKTIVGNPSTGCQYGTIFPDYSISLNDVHLKDCSKLLVGVQGLNMIEDSEYLSTLVQASFQLTNTVHPKLK